MQITCQPNLLSGSIRCCISYSKENGESPVNFSTYKSSL